MTPAQFLFLLLATTALAAGLQWVQRQRQLRALRALAAQWKLHFSDVDRFRLAPRVAMALAVPGAAAVRVSDLLYGLEKGEYRYFFRTEYTVGVLHAKSRVRRVGTFRERRDAAPGAQIKLELAPEELRLTEQYRRLYETSKAADEKV